MLEKEHGLKTVEKLLIGLVTTEIFNVTIASPDIEQSLALPSTIVGYLIRSRGNSALKISHVVGESGTKYVTIPGRATHVDEHTYSSLIIYFQSPVAGDTIEIMAWKA